MNFKKQRKNKGPLSDMKILDCTQVMAGPFCTMLLADMGATVVKIENPDGGDPMRTHGPEYFKNGTAAFLALNRNKNSLAIDLKTIQGKRIFKKLVKEFDVIVENFKPSTMDNLGLGYEVLKKINRRLIYCSISGFGSSGPYKNRPGFDLIAQGMSGVMSFTGLEDGTLVKVGVPLGDLNSGLYGSYGILSAYINLLRTGKGQFVDTSLLDASIASTFWQAAVYFSTSEIPRPLGTKHPFTAPYQVFRTKDDYIVIGGASQRAWESLCVALDCLKLIDDKRFNTSKRRKDNENVLAKILQDIFTKKTTNVWLKILDKNHVPVGPIYSLDQVFNDPHVQAREMVINLEDLEGNKIKHIGLPVKLSDTPGNISYIAPKLGEHSKDILLEYGFSELDISKFISKNIIKV